MFNIDPFLNSINPGKRLHVQGAVGASKSFILARLFLKLKKTIVLVVSDLNEANVWYTDLKFFIPTSVEVIIFPSLDVNPYYNLSPNPDVIMDRLQILWKLNDQNRSHNPLILIVPLKALSRKLIPRSLFTTSSEIIVKEQDLERSEFLKKLNALAYQRVSLVEDQGTFAIRGSILDLYSPAHETPCRIEFFGDTIESIRFFDPNTQKSIKETDQIALIPAREVLLESLPSNWNAKLKKLSDDCDIPKPERDRVSEFVSQKINFNGIESFISFFYPNPSSLFDYLPNDSLFCFSDFEVILNQLDKNLKELKDHQAQSTSIERIFPPEQIFLQSDEVKELVSYFPQCDFEELSKDYPNDLKISCEMESNLLLQQKLKTDRSSEKALEPLVNELNEKRKQGSHIFLVGGSPAQIERLKDLLKRYELPLESEEQEGEVKKTILKALNGEPPSPFIQIVSGPISQGFYWAEEKTWWITDEEIFGQKIRKPHSKPVGEIFSSFADLHVGDYIVHQDHGIGIYKGLVNLKIQEVQNDFLLLEYLGGDKLYVPVDQLDRISRFSSQEGLIPMLDKMGGATWKKVREKVKRATRKLAKELLEMQALRQSAKGFAFSPSNTLFEEFEATFPFDETIDQLKAIEDVLKDMEQERPMDRLVCGDVGYGKTEVAIRAAFKAILDHKQVAVLVPTTVLAFQHYETFKKRFKDFAVNVALLSRFQNPADQKKIVTQLKAGEIDIIIATHRLLSEDIAIRDLGLLVIDEEHRFGVAQKEKIKKLKTLVDVLTLSATPIPRTLNFALVGIRDLSLINTPPADRLSIRTYVTHFDEGTIRESILNEVKRGGQIYFVHNRVQTIRGMQERLQKIIPEVKIRVAHGQMPEDELEEAMIDFMEKKFEVLLCTTIIESGLDIPSANTIIINRADHMGLAQLYQLRGRVGRSFHRAYCYLLIPGDTIITGIAKKRLAVIQKFTELGSGFKIASHDLEIRGAGNILGAEQSGNIASVGYDLYLELLKEAIDELKGEITHEEIETELKFPVSASIPEDLVPDTQLRLVLYKQLSSLKNEADCLDLREEWMDRFGPLPAPVENLIRLIMVRILAQKLKMTLVTYQQGSFIYQIHPHSSIPTNYFLEKVKKEPKKYKILPDGKFSIVEKPKSDLDVFEISRRHLSEMTKGI